MRLKARRLAGGIVLAALLVGAVACSSSNNNKKAAAGAGTPAPTPAASGARTGGIIRFDKAPPFTIDPNKGYLATIKFPTGDVVIELNAQAAPLTVNNFIFLARQHFYDGVTCHRVIPNFVAQCGDPEGTGGGGPGYTIPDEKSPLLHGVGAVAMAKTNAPNSAGSQFYITMAPQPSLNGNYTVFGQVISGQDVVDKLTPRDPATNPNAPPGERIISITIQETNQTPTPFAAPAASPKPTP
ncbi:MAG TPA: peptidylprolyl isomerase [Dehalococcoidia bacterium]|nr:peptidylprolyl isomerase [Dehalococcoidia bacterium]